MERKTMRKKLSQFIAVGAASILTLCLGIGWGFLTIIIPELNKNDAEIVVTVAELTWICDLSIFCQPVGSVAGGFISHYLGRRKLLILSPIPYGISWLLIHFSSQSVWLLFLGFILFGLTNGLIQGPILVYVSEICEPTMRGSSLSFISSIIAISTFIPILMGSYLHWKTIALYNVIVPVIAVIALYFVPESPYWLANRGRLDESRRALAWLRGWTTTEKVTHEFSFILKYSQQQISNSNDKCKSCHFFRHGILVPFTLIIFMFFVSTFGGRTSISTYPDLIFEIIECPINSSIASYSMAGLQTIATITSIFSIPWAGKRKVIFASLTIAGTTLLIITIYIFLREHHLINQSNKYNWIPSSCLILSVFASTFGIKIIPWIVTGEVFPIDVRSEAVGITTAASNIFSAIAIKIFGYMMVSMKLSGNFLFFTIVNFIGFGVLYYTLPETEARSLPEIERYFERHRRTKVKNTWKDKEKRFVFDNASFRWSRSVHES